MQSKLAYKPHDYRPRLNDYVKWHKGNHSVEGWVYYVDKQYITLETSVIPKPKEDIPNAPIHKNHRCLVLCYPEYYNQLEYITHRENVHAESTTIDIHESPLSK